jgi:hypothetical protein
LMQLKNVAFSEFMDVISFSEHVGNVSQNQNCDKLQHWILNLKWLQREKEMVIFAPRRDSNGEKRNYWNKKNKFLQDSSPEKNDAYSKKNSCTECLVHIGLRSCLITRINKTTRPGNWLVQPARHLTKLFSLVHPDGLQTWHPAETSQ